MDRDFHKIRNFRVLQNLSATIISNNHRSLVSTLYHFTFRNHHSIIALYRMFFHDSKCGMQQCPTARHPRCVAQLEAREHVDVCHRIRRAIQPQLSLSARGLFRPQIGCNQRDIGNVPAARNRSDSYIHVIPDYVVRYVTFSTIKYISLQ